MYLISFPLLPPPLPFGDAASRRARESVGNIFYALYISHIIPSNMQMNFYYTLLRPLLTAGVPYLRLRNNIFFSPRCKLFPSIYLQPGLFDAHATPCSHSFECREEYIPTALSGVAPSLVLSGGELARSIATFNYPTTARKYFSLRVALIAEHWREHLSGVVHAETLVQWQERGCHRRWCNVARNKAPANAKGHGHGGGGGIRRPKVSMLSGGVLAQSRLES